MEAQNKCYLIFDLIDLALRCLANDLNEIVWIISQKSPVLWDVPSKGDSYVTRLWQHNAAHQSFSEVFQCRLKMAGPTQQAAHSA